MLEPHVFRYHLPIEGKGFAIFMQFQMGIRRQRGRGHIHQPEISFFDPERPQRNGPPHHVEHHRPDRKRQRSTKGNARRSFGARSQIQKKRRFVLLNR